MEKNKLHKSVSLINAFSIAAGAMISSGLFVLPGIVYDKAGPSIILAYFCAGILMLPTMMVQSELATAMPKAGGAYFYIMRILGPKAGFIAGIANWFSIAMKSAFALVGIGTFLTLINPDIPEFQIRLFAAGAAVFFILINLFSTKHSSNLQTILLISLLIILSLFILGGYPQIKGDHFSNFFLKDFSSFFGAVGMVFISYGGLTKIASMSEEIKDSAKNVPKAMFSAFFIMNIFYILVITVVVGLLPHSTLVKTLTPVSTAAQSFAGNVGLIVTSIAAMLAFITTANAGIMSASRTPLAMSRDGLIPDFFSKISPKNKTPYTAILFTGTFMVVVILGLKIESLVKVASAFILILFIIVSLTWYYFYSRNKKFTQSALVMLVEKIINERLEKEAGHKNIEEELFEILQHRDEIYEDFFDKRIEDGFAFDLNEQISRDDFFRFISKQLHSLIDLSEDEIYKQFKKRENLSSTNITDHVAIPHIIVPGKKKFKLGLVRIKKGIKWDENSPPVNAVFILIGTMDMREYHLKSLMAVSQLLQNDDFFDKWMNADDEKDLKNTIRLMPRKRHKKDIQ